MGETQRQSASKPVKAATQVKPEQAKPSSVVNDRTADFLWMQQTLGNQAVQKWASANPDSNANPTEGISPTSPTEKPDQFKGRSVDRPQQNMKEGIPERQSPVTTQASDNPTPEAKRPIAETKEKLPPGKPFSNEPTAEKRDPVQGRVPTHLTAESDKQNQTPSHSKPTAEASTPNQEPDANPSAAGPDPSSQTSAPALIVEDSFAELKPGQMRKSEFLSMLRALVHRTAEEALAGTGRSATDCPYIDFWFEYYSTQDVKRIQRALRKYAPETQSFTTTNEVIPVFLDRVRYAVKIWSTTGLVTGIPDDLPADAARMANPNSFDAGSLSQATEVNNPRIVQDQLGSGTPIDGSVRARMEPGFGMNFSSVRVHTDTKAAQLSARQDARAFTVGNHIAFASGEYRPGTLTGDALIAHELAHVAQQKSASPSVGAITGDDSSYAALEEDADKSVEGVIASLWSGTKRDVGNIAQNAMPRLRSGLRISRCDSKPAPAPEEKKPAPTEPVPDAGPETPPKVTIAEVNAANTPLPVKRIPPRVNTDVQVAVDGKPRTPVTLAIEGSGGAGGTAVINGNATYNLKATEAVHLKGVDQTRPGNANQLKLVAKQGTNKLAQSNAFSVAAYPKGAAFTARSSVEGVTIPGVRNPVWAARYRFKAISDSGDNEDGRQDLDKTTVSENLIIAVAEGYFAGLPSSTSDFLPSTDTPTDHHGIFGSSAASIRKRMDTFDLSKSKAEQIQFFRFACQRTDIAESKEAGPKVPFSGFKVTMTMANAGGLYLLRVKKEGFDNNGVNVGTIDDTTIKNVTI